MNSARPRAHRHHPPGARDVVPPVGDHRTPGGDVRRHAQAQVAERRFEKDHPGHQQGRDDRGRRRDVREHMPEQDARDGSTQCLGRLHELTLPQHQALGADDAHVLDPIGETQHQHEVDQAGAQYGHHGDGEYQEGDRQLDVGQHHQAASDITIFVARDQPQPDADDGRYGGGQHTHQQRHPGAHDHPRQNIPAQRVRAEPMRAGIAGREGRQQASEDVLVVRVERREVGAAGRTGHDSQQDQHSEQRQAAAEEAAGKPHPFRRRGSSMA